jgi:hypothetical protein
MGFLNYLWINWRILSFKNLLLFPQLGLMLNFSSVLCVWRLLIHWTYKEGTTWFSSRKSIFLLSLVLFYEFCSWSFTWKLFLYYSLVINTCLKLPATITSLLEKCLVFSRISNIILLWSWILPFELLKSSVFFFLHIVETSPVGFEKKTNWIELKWLVWTG